ncbi:MAG: hypothetical protein PHQ90_07800 [Sulfuricurvum sp.]|uniref:hypothetical protein n=1 Tax=Sulfuricurvum sp. TaxID=2025608 RepID=UPI002611C82E|nr:hypothetical protein [Sulfuricurvum sp.]MDD2369188.1 hypothetical protein [Sulfuricurvum sp.]MDD2951174.1 hypothetical protein [Sulfuricurvum sp.]MDD5117894.1 hypothetical protein [Sulfuricurvum sp.]
MFLVLEVGFFVFAFYRGRGIEALFALVAFVGVTFGLLESGYDQPDFIHLADGIFIITLIVMGLFPKKEKLSRCPQCDALILEDRLSCKECGYLFKNDVAMEKSSKNISTKTIVMKTIDEFEKIKNQIIEQYAPLGYTTRSIDKEDSLMLKNEYVNNSYILLKRDGFEATIDIYNVNKNVV